MDKYYINKIENQNSQNIINISSINFYEIKNHQFIEDLLIDFFIFDKAKVEDFNKYFKQDYLEKIECIAKSTKEKKLNLMIIINI